MGRRSIAILCAYGPEVRAFLHSGLAGELSRRHEVAVITVRPESGAFRGLDGLPVLRMPTSCECTLLQHVRYWSDVLHEEWMRTRRGQRWRHYLPRENGLSGNGGRFRRIARAVAHWESAAAAAHVVEGWCGRRWGTHKEWRQLFQGAGIECVLCCSYASQRTLPALQTAANLGLTTVVVPNSWKDVYSKPYVPLVPDRLAVWSEDVARDLRSVNPHVGPERIAVCGSLHLERFIEPGAVMDRVAFCARFGLDAARPFICYTAAAPAAVRNEECVVEALLRAVESGRVAGQPQVLLRLNPMEGGGRFGGLVRRHADLRLQKPLWEWDAERDWCCALPEDSDLWVATACHAAVNVSIPSTVTLEFTALGRPVVNVCFDLPEEQPAAASNRRFWDAEFYREIRESGLAAAAFTEGELVERISEALLRTGHGTGSSRAARAQPRPVQAVVTVIESALAG